MTLEKNQIRKGQQGFTLVELAVVMIIVGLLIGGILKGQELIANAQVTSTVSQMKGIESAVTTFRDTYRSMPGAMGNATTRLPNCTAPCGNGAGGSRLGNAPDVAAVVTDDGTQMFLHLLRADLLSGFEGNVAGSTTFGENLPSASAGGGFYAGFSSDAAGLGVNANARQGHYLSMRGLDTAPVATTGAINAVQGLRIDGKSDDGVGNTGTVFADDAANCLVAADGSYDTGNSAQNCNLYIRIQN